MLDAKHEVTQHLSVINGLAVSGVNHAADMLTLQFGELSMVTTRRGGVKHVGAWALHIRCGWQIERAGAIVATQADFRKSDDETTHAAERVHDLLVTSGPTTVESVLAGDVGDLCISMSRDTRLIIKSDRVAGDEDWRFFSPGSDGKHFVIEGGLIDPYHYPEACLGTSLKKACAMMCRSTASL